MTSRACRSVGVPLVDAVGLYVFFLSREAFVVHHRHRIFIALFFASPALLLYSCSSPAAPHGRPIHPCIRPTKAFRVGRGRCNSLALALLVPVQLVSRNAGPPPRPGILCFIVDIAYTCPSFATADDEPLRYERRNCVRGWVRNRRIVLYPLPGPGRPFRRCVFQPLPETVIADDTDTGGGCMCCSEMTAIISGEVGIVECVDVEG